MNAPQIILVSLWCLLLLVTASKNGQPKDPENYSLPVVVIRIGIWVALLSWGGFFPWPWL